MPGCAPHAVTVQSAATELRLPPGPPFTRARSAAACTLQGRTALLLSYPDEHAESAAAAFAYPNTAYFAAGAGWLAVPIDRSEPVGQQSIVQDVALALHGHVGIGAKAPRVSPAGG